MNLKLRDEESLRPEYQNEPLSRDADTPLLLTPQNVIERTRLALARGVVPSWATRADGVHRRSGDSPDLRGCRVGDGFLVMSWITHLPR